MTQEPEPDKNQESNANNIIVPKLAIDKPSDFRFHAAFLTYSQAWDKAISPEIKTKLNEIIFALSKSEIDYQSFYEQIRQYRSEFNPEHYGGGGRTFIETQRKKDWRRMQERNARNARHKR
jgi:hypothetical protein